MSPSVHSYHLVSREACFGVRFRDAATGQYIGDGLVVSVWPESRPALRQRASVNPSSVWVLSDLPGLRALPPGSPRKRFSVEVRDTEGRFLPCSFQVELPSRTLLTLECLPDTPPSPLWPPEPALPLFSAPSRHASPLLAVVRAELWDVKAEAPAAWARLEVRVKDELVARGLADAQGRAALFFDSPAILQDAPLREQSWTLRLEAFYTPAGPVPPLAPDLRGTLRQPAARLWPDTSGAQPHLELTLHYGQPLVVRTQQDTHSRLRLTPAGS
ncbi:MAG TPA: hypothetical protein VFZ09_25200 [Archangium sp.]|uniref:hypothetical protein n=1 Tax=Archangium sp. TaxID=1872627 RepID=UPI002E35E73A|nr:hypothetical protein [Archangium sp.]HEX5749551.1 hypothetical protein [Archangium sp.]